MNILYINSCIKFQSRTKILANYLLKKLSGTVEEINLNKENPKPLNNKTLLKRNQLLEQKRYDDPIFSYAQKFAKADIIIIAAPYWDFSFPALLKILIEHINAVGIVFKYAPDGQIIPLCHAKTLYYVTTMGGHNPIDFGFGYIKTISSRLYGIQDIRLIKAEGLDIQGNNVSEILENTKKEIDFSI